MPIYFLLFWSTLIVSTIAAFVWAEWPEKSAGILYLAAALATELVKPAWRNEYHHVETAVFVVDVLLLVGLIWIAIRADRWWPICAIALQFLTVLAHLGKALNPNLWRLGYQLMAVWAAWPMVLVLAFAVWHNRRPRRKAAT